MRVIAKAVILSVSGVHNHCSPLLMKRMNNYLFVHAVIGIDRFPFYTLPGNYQLSETYRRVRGRN